MMECTPPAEEEPAEEVPAEEVPAEEVPAEEEPAEEVPAEEVPAEEELVVRIDNLFDSRYQAVNGYSSPGISFYLGVKQLI